MLSQAAAGNLAGLGGVNRMLSEAAAAVLDQPQADAALISAARMWQAAIDGQAAGRYPGFPVTAYRVWAGALAAALRGEAVRGVLPGDPPYRAILRSMLDTPHALATANGTQTPPGAENPGGAEARMTLGIAVTRALEVGSAPAELRALAAGLRATENPIDYRDARRALFQTLCRDVGYAACPDCGQFMSPTRGHDCPASAVRAAFTTPAVDDDAWRALEQAADALAETPGRPDLAAAARRFIREGTLAAANPATAAFPAALRGDARVLPGGVTPPDSGPLAGTLDITWSASPEAQTWLRGAPGLIDLANGAESAGPPEADEARALDAMAAAIDSRPGSPRDAWGDAARARQS